MVCRKSSEPSFIRGLESRVAPLAPIGASGASGASGAHQGKYSYPSLYRELESVLSKGIGQVKEDNTLAR
jgi:hypothetical protein